MANHPSEQFPIRTICSLTGVNPITLRAWERRYGLIQPLRTPKGHRLYNYQHVDRIRRVLTLVENGIPISLVRDVLDSEVQAPKMGRSQGPWQEYLEQMTAAVARFDEPELDRIYDAALALHPIEQLTDRLLLPLLARLGERWETFSEAIAEEHFFAVYLRSKLGARLQHRMRYATGPRLVAACAPGEHHEIGLLLFALEANVAGFRTVVLGANTPFHDIALAQRQSASSAIVISSSIDPAPGLLEHALPKLVEQTGVPVFIGGAAALRHRKAVTAAGAIALGVKIENGVRLIAAALTAQESGS